MKSRTSKYKCGTPLIRFIRFDDLFAFGMIVNKTFNFYIVEWYLQNGEIETESCVERSIKHYWDNYKEYKVRHRKRKEKVGE